MARSCPHQKVWRRRTCPGHLTEGEGRPPEISLRQTFLPAGKQCRAEYDRQECPSHASAERSRQFQDRIRDLEHLVILMADQGIERLLDPLGGVVAEGFADEQISLEIAHGVTVAIAVPVVVAVAVSIAIRMPIAVAIHLG